MTSQLCFCFFEDSLVCLSSSFFLRWERFIFRWSCMIFTTVDSDLFCSFEIFVDIRVITVS